MDPRSNFRFEEAVGRDQLGEVFRGTDANDNVLAIKVFDAWTVEKEESREAYARALAILRALKPRRTPPILGYRIREENAWIATQWIQSQTLHSYLDANGDLSEQDAATVACGILDALAELHSSKFAHGGITPRKILLTDDLNAGGVVITDPFQHYLYSVSNPIETVQSGDERFIGLPEYFSPEQVQGAKPDLRSDIYVIGLIIYKMLTGRTPFESGNPSIILKRQIHEQPLPPRLVKPGLEISSEFEEIIQVALSKDVDQRFDSPRTMRDAIAAIRDSGDSSSERNAAPLGAYPVSAEVPDDDATASLAARALSDTPTSAVDTSEVAAAVAASPSSEEDDFIIDMGDDESFIESLDEDLKVGDDDPVFEELDDQQASHSYDGTDEITLEAIEDFAALAAEFDYGFDDEQTNSWFAAGDDAEEMESLHGDERPASPKVSEKRHNQAFYVLVPLALIAAVAAALLISGGGDDDVEEANDEEVVAEEGAADEQAEGTEVVAAADEQADATEAETSDEENEATAEADAEGADTQAEEGEAAEQVAAADQTEGDEADEEPRQAAEETDESTRTASAERRERQREREERAQASAAQQSDGPSAGSDDSGSAGSAPAADTGATAGGSTAPAGGTQTAAATGDQTGSGSAPSGTADPASTAGDDIALAVPPGDPEAEAVARRRAEAEREQREAERRAREEEERRRQEEARQRAAQSEQLAEQGATALNSGNLDHARRLFNEALMLNAGNAAAHAGLGDTYFRMNEYQRAIPHHQAAGRYRALGMDYFRLNDFPRALRAFERAAAQGDPNAERYVNIVKQRMGQ